MKKTVLFILETLNEVAPQHRKQINEHVVSLGEPSTEIAAAPKAAPKAAAKGKR